MRPQVAEISAPDQRILSAIADVHQQSDLPPRLSDVARRLGFFGLYATTPATLIKLGLVQRHHGRIRLTPKSS